MIEATGTSATVPTVLSVKNLWFRYRGSSTWVLRGVNLEVSPGEIVLIVGSSGSGKTTLVRAVTGVGRWIYGADVRGEVWLDGRKLEELSLGEVRRIIQVVNQNPYTHFIEYFVGDDLLSTATAVHGQEVGVRIFRKVVVALKLEELLRRRFFELSGGQLRRVAIAKALLWNPKVIVLDEPLMWLDDEGVEELKEVMMITRALGKALVVFEHRFASILPLVDKALLLKGGVLAPIDRDELRRPKTKSGVSQHPLSRLGDVGDIEQEGPVVEVKDLWFSYDGGRSWVLRGVNLSIGTGSSVVIYGPNGSGKSTLLKLVAGYLSPSRGRVSRRARAVYLPQNIYLFFTEESIKREFEEVCSSAGRGRECVERGVRMMKELGVSVDVEESPFNLSWGQAIRVAISLAASTGNSILLMDEPFTGLTYAERLSLAILLTKLRMTKVIAVSSRDSLGLIPWSEAYELKGGRLSPTNVKVNGELVALARRCEELGLHGAL